MQARHWRGVAAFAAVTTLLAAFAGGAQARTDGGSGTTAAASYKVGIVYSRTGLLAAYGAEYIQGLRYGLAYATKGTMKVNGRPIELTIVDDGTDPTKAVAAGRDLIGKGYKILAGSVSSGVALQMAPGRIRTGTTLGHAFHGLDVGLGCGKDQCDPRRGSGGEQVA